MVAERPSADVRHLYGGAITTQIPSEYEDISVIREVPDNQEVFSHADTDRSVIVELLEMHQEIPEGQVPAQFHLNNIAEESDALESTTQRVLTLAPRDEIPTILSNDPNVSVTAAYGTHRVTKFKDAEEHASIVDVYVVCVRLPRVTTDLLIVFNDARVLHPEGSSARSGSVVAQEEGDSPRDKVLRTALRSLKIVDWGLLG